MPLETAAAAPRAEVDPLVYMPPALRYPTTTTTTTPPPFPLTLPLANLTPHLPFLTFASALILSCAPMPMVLLLLCDFGLLPFDLCWACLLTGQQLDSWCSVALQQ